MKSAEKIQSLGQLVARILIGMLFIAAGVFERHAHSFYFPYLASIGGGQPEFTLPLGYVLEICAAAALILGWRTRWAAWALIFHTVLLTLLFNGIAGPDDAHYFDKLSHVMKNLGVVAGLLYIAAIGAGGYSLDARRDRGRKH